MTEQTAEDDAPGEAGDLQPEPRILPGILIGLATLVAILGTFTTWVKVQALDTDEWASISSELLDEPEIREALSVYLVDELYEEVDVTSEVEDMLPENLEGLAGPVSAALRGPATTGVERIIDSEAFRASWETTMRASHQVLVSILRDETRPGVSTADGTVTLELGDLVRSVGANLGLSDSFLDQIPDDAGRIVVFESDELDKAQTTVQLLDFLSWFLFVAMVILYAAAVYFAPGQRMTMLAFVGRSLLVVGVIVLIVRTLAVRLLVDAIVDDAASRSIWKLTAFVSTGLLRQIGWSALSYGVVIMLFTALLGSGRWAVSARRVLAPALNGSTGAVVAGTTILLLLLLWWSPGRVFEGWATGLVLIAMIIGAISMLTARSRQEFPGVSIGDVADSITSGLASEKDSVARD